MAETREQKTVSILGTGYSVKYRIARDDPKLKEASGYTETYSKEIIIDDSEPEEQTLNDLEGFKRKVLRHEIVHAFLHESGLDAGSDWARNEEIVDWIALQFEKMQRAMQEVGALSCGGTYR